MEGPFARRHAQGPDAAANLRAAIRWMRPAVDAGLPEAPLELARLLRPQQNHWGPTVSSLRQIPPTIRDSADGGPCPERCCS